MNSEDKWQQAATKFRHRLPEESVDTPLPGFSTRIVALADLGNDSSLMIRLRNWSLGTAAASAIALTVLISLQEPKTQFIPVPELNLPTTVTP